MSSVLDALSSVGGRIPGWTPVVFLGLFIMLLLLGRFLDLLDTTAAGVEKAVGDAKVNGATLRSYFIDYEYRSYARAVWGTIVAVFGALFVIAAIAVMANAFKSPGWERE